MTSCVLFRVFFGVSTKATPIISCVTKNFRGWRNANAPNSPHTSDLDRTLPNQSSCHGKQHNMSLLILLLASSRSTILLYVTGAKKSN